MFLSPLTLANTHFHSTRYDRAAVVPGGQVHLYALLRGFLGSSGTLSMFLLFR